MDRLLHECPQLDAIWHEVLRVYNGASVAREAMVDTVVGGKEVPKGQKIVAPFRQFLLDGDVFGADPLIFNPERFLRKKNLHKAKGYSPFGGGSTYCPGRFFAQREIYMFIAWTYQRFDLSVEPGAVIPPIDLATPCPAAMKPNGDMNVTLKPRVHRK
jgi:cytochrome P450